MTVSSDKSRKATNKPLDPVLVGWAIFLFFPLGLYLLWRHPTLGRNAKWWASGIAWACVLLMFSGRAEKEGAAGTPPAARQTRDERSGPADPGEEALAVLRQCWIGSTPDSVEALMRQKDFGRKSIRTKTIDGKPHQFHLWEPGGVGFCFGRNKSTGDWGLVTVQIDGHGYFPPMSKGDKPIRMN